MKDKLNYLLFFVIFLTIVSAFAYEDFFNYLFLIILSVPFLILFIFYVRSRGRSVKPLYRALGGIRKGRSFWVGMNASWPLARIEIFRDKVNLDYLFSNIEFRKEDIDYFSRFRGRKTGVRIHHKIKDESPFILFWNLFSSKKLLKTLEEAGYEVR